MPTPEHLSRRVEAVGCAIVTVSDSRTPATDRSGPLIREMLDAAGHAVSSYEVIPDDLTRIRQAVAEACARGSTGAVIVTGGTGVAARDVTPEAVAPLLEKGLPGFGELFRMLSYHEIGPAAMLSRATAGVCGRVVVFVLPGSVAAVCLAMEKLILPQLGHLAGLLAESATQPPHPSESR